MARISVPISDALNKKLCKLLPYGIKAEFIRRVIEVTVDQIEDHGVVIIAQIISGRYNPIKTIEERGKLK